MERYLPTGSELLSLPRVNEKNGAVEDLGFLHMGSRGLIELRGGEAEPLMRPFVELDGAEAGLSDFEWERLGFWYPRFEARSGGLRIEGVILAPVGERGFGYRLRFENTGPAAEFRFGLRGLAGSAWHCVNVDKRIEGSLRCFVSGWSGLPVFEQMCGVPLFALRAHLRAGGGGGVRTRGGRPRLRGSRARLALRRGSRRSSQSGGASGLKRYPPSRARGKCSAAAGTGSSAAASPGSKGAAAFLRDGALTRLYNTNLFFCIFYSTGRTLDTEELVLVTSRSPRYYVSAAYWDRDSLLWSFPAVLDADPALAREMLGYVFGRQRRNIGVHSRFIDGAVLEPGFELDELVAPVLALERYADETGDLSVFEAPDVRRGIEEILRKLDAVRAEGCELYETFLQPTDDERVYPYLTYDNVLALGAPCGRLDGCWDERS